MGMKTESGLRSEDELARETLKIMKFDFNTLITAVRLSLQRRRVSVESLLCHLRSIEAIGPSFKPVYVGHSHSLKTVTSSEFRSLEEVFVALAPYCSWFNYLIIENIIETFCEGDKALERKWMRFQEKVRRYCERRVIDCPEDQYGERDDESMVRETVAMKVDRNWSTIRVDQLYHIRDSVAKVLDIKPCNLYLCTVEKGCVRVVLYIPDHVVSKFNCTASTEMALRNIDVIDISYVTWKSKIPRKHRRLMANVGSDLSFVQYSPPAITEPDLLVVPYSPPAATRMYIIVLCNIITGSV